jgi:hypothetical protein
MAIQGSCLCGTARYELTQDPLWAHNCHCSRCRKTRGAAFASNLFVARDGFRFSQGQEQVRSYKPPGAERFTHAFSAKCGSSLPREPALALRVRARWPARRPSAIAS